LKSRSKLTIKNLALTFELNLFGIYSIKQVWAFEFHHGRETFQLRAHQLKSSHREKMNLLIDVHKKKYELFPSLGSKSWTEKQKGLTSEKTKFKQMREKTPPANWVLVVHQVASLASVQSNMRVYFNVLIPVYLIYSEALD
jgi:hypothetical protein